MCGSLCAEVSVQGRLAPRQVAWRRDLVEESRHSEAGRKRSKGPGREL